MPSPISDSAAVRHLDDHRVEMKIGEHAQILPPGKGRPGMNNFARGPDGTIYITTAIPSDVLTNSVRKSTDGGHTWEPAIPVEKFTDPRLWPYQTIGAFTVTRDGRWWAVHGPAGAVGDAGVPTGIEEPYTGEPQMWISRSSDRGHTWESTKMDFSLLSPEGSREPYASYPYSPADCLIELPDGTVMFGANLFYPDQLKGREEGDDLDFFLGLFRHPDPSRRGLREVMVRTRDAGRTWGEATIVQQYGATEVNYAVDPTDPDHILAASRKQRGVLPDEEEAREAVYEKARAPAGFAYPFKGTQLLESNDGGRRFCEVPDGYAGFYSHRGTICWTDRDVVIVSYMFDPALPQGARASTAPAALGVAVSISLDGGRTWVDGTGGGTSSFEASERSVINPEFGGTAPTIEVEPNRYLTAYSTYPGDDDNTIEGFFWQLESASGKVLDLPLARPRAVAPVPDPARRAAACRRRRVIFQNDGDDLYHTPEPATIEKFLSVRMDHVADTGVDSVFYFYFTGVSPLYHNARRDQRAAELGEAGTDALQLAIETCRKGDIEIVCTLKVNDMHDAGGSISPWKEAHRHLLMGEPGLWTCVDYAHEEVRDLMVSTAADVMDRYDVDGIELDFLRHTLYFKETRQHDPATAEHLDMLSDMMGKLRAAVLAASERRGKPILLSVRLLPTVALNRKFGIDIERWLRRGYVDLLTIGGGYDPFTVTVSGREMIDLGHARGLPVYVCISGSAMVQRGVDHSLLSLEAFNRLPDTGGAHVGAWRAAAANAWQAGADGIMTFNLFPSLPGTDTTRVVRQIWSEIADPALLAGADKLYCIENLDYSRTLDHMMRSVPWEDRLPADLPRGNTCERVLPVADDITGSSDQLRGLCLRICLSGLQAGDVVDVRMNGRPVETTPEEPEWLAAELEPSAIKQGHNILAVTYQAGRSEALTITSVELTVEYRG